MLARGSALHRLLYAILIVGPVMAFVGTSVFVLGMLRAPAVAIDVLARLFSRSVLLGTRARVVAVEGLGPSSGWPAQMVLVCNHESHLDGPLILARVRDRSIRFVVKRSLMWIPFLGWGLKGAGCVAVTRRDSSKDFAALAGVHGRPGVDLLFFAEGSRSRDGDLRPFKKGAFIHAIEERLPILPLAVAGTWSAMRPHRWFPRGGPVALVVGEPIDVTGLTFDDRDALRDRVRAEVERLRDRAKTLVGGGDAAKR